MENAVEALKMAGSILLFVLALSVAIPIIGQARATADSVMAYSDREGEYLKADKLGEDFFYYVGNGDNKVRKVGVDTIIPAIYRSYKENSKIVFTKDNIDTPLYLYRFRKK